MATESNCVNEKGGPCFGFPVINGEFFKKLIGSSEVGILSPAVEKRGKVFPARCCRNGLRQLGRTV